MQLSVLLHCLREGNRLFETVRFRPDRVVIREEWIERAIQAPVQEQVQADGRIRRWAGAGSEKPVFACRTARGRRDSPQCVL